MRTIRFLIAVATVLCATAGPAPSDAAPPDLVSVEGDLMAFGPNADPIAGLTVRVLEQPGLTAVTDGSGHWRIDDVPVGSTATFALDGGERPPIQTATFTVPTTGLDHVTFQSPDHAIVDALEAVVGESSRPDRCQIASTVTRRGYSLYGGAPDGTHGEPGATVAITPTPAAGSGPIYFNGSSFDVIWPDRSLTETTADGGVLFTNVTPGTYTLTATKAGATIQSVTVGCRAGVLTNASPPWGLQVLTGGLDLDETVPFPSPTTTSTTATTTTTTTATIPGAATPTAPPSPTAATPVEQQPRYVG